MLLKPRHKYVKRPVQQLSCHLQGCFGSNGVDPQLEFTSVTSMDLPHWAPTEALWPTCSTSLAADYSEIIETNVLSGVKRITKNWDCILAAGLVHCTMAILIKQIQVTPSRKCWETLARSSWLMTACCSTAPLLSQSCSPVFSTNTPLMFLVNGTH